MEINLSEDASKLNNSFKPEKGIFSEEKNTEDFMVEEFSSTSGFDQNATADSIKPDIPIKALLSNGFKLLHADLSKMQAIGVVVGAGSVASSLFSGSASGVASGLVGALGQALGSFAGGIAQGLGNSLQDLDTVKNDPEMQDIKRAGLLAYTKAFYDPSLQEAAGTIVAIAETIGKAIGGFAGGAGSAIGTSISDTKMLLEDDSAGLDINKAEDREKSVYLIRRYGILSYAKAYYDPELQSGVGTVSAIANAVGQAIGGLAGGAGSAIGTSLANTVMLLADDSEGLDINKAEDREKSIYLIRKYGLLSYAKGFYDPDLQQGVGKVTAIADAVGKAIGELAPEAGEAMAKGIADTAMLLEDDSEGLDINNPEERDKSVYLIRKFGMLSYAKGFYDPKLQETAGTFSAIAQAFGSLGASFFTGLIKSAFEGISDTATLLTDKDILDVKKKGLMAYTQTLYGEEAMTNKANLALKSSEWGEVAGGAIKGLSSVVTAGIDAIGDVWDSLTGKSKKGESTPSGSQVPILQVESNDDYTTPLNTISRASNLISSNVIKILSSIESQTDALETKLNDLSTRIYELNEGISGALSQPPVPAEFRTADIEA